MSFLNATTGWVTGRVPVNGYSLLYRTYDGGATWYPQSLPLSPTERSSQLSLLPPLFFNATDGILPVSFDMGKGASLDVYVTHDGGTTWKGTTPLTAAASTADFIDVDHGWASDGTLLYVTGDSGKQWTRFPRVGVFSASCTSTLCWVTSAGLLVRQQQALLPFSRPRMVDEPGQPFPTPSHNSGTALAVLTLVGGLSSPIFIPLAGILVAHVGWRSTLVALGIAQLAIALPLHAFLLRRHPEDLGLSPMGNLLSRYRRTRLCLAQRSQRRWGARSSGCSRPRSRW